MAVALLRPAVVLGMRVGPQNWQAASGAALLPAINVVCVNLTAAATSVAQGVQPRRWWEADQARPATRRALALWALLLVLLMFLVAQLPAA